MKVNRVFLLSFAVVLILTLSSMLSSCKKNYLNADGSFCSVDAAKQNAKKKNQDILLIITTGTDDLMSELFIKNVLTTDVFKNSITKKYTVLHMDFSEDSYQRTVVNPEADKKTQKVNEEYSQMMFKNAKIASQLNVTATPAVFLFTQEMYYISKVIFEEDLSNAAQLEVLLNKYEQKIETVHEKVSASKKGSSEERIKAIDELYEMTDPAYKVFLSELYDVVIDLDKNDKTGLLSKYLVAHANSLSTSYFMEGKIDEAVNELLEICKNKYLSQEDRQQSYYMAAYLYAMSGDTNLERMSDLLQKSIDASPQFQSVNAIVNFKDYIDGMIKDTKIENSASGSNLDINAQSNPSAGGQIQGGMNYYQSTQDD